MGSYRYCISLLVTFLFFQDVCCQPAVDWLHVGMVALCGFWVLYTLDVN